MNRYVLMCVLFLLSLKLRFGSTLRFEKPVAETIWKKSCSPHSRILNDCNWCRCVNGRYKCDARACNEVDMFGHFNDAIQDINVGMEGHGVWRTGQTSCKPGVHYHRNDLLCICTDNGSWPSPVCRDTFRILHPVEIVKNVATFEDQDCTPEKLYLIGCNVCFCPAEGTPDPKLCTRKVCAQNDPVFDIAALKDDVELVRGWIGEVYAKCRLDKKYKLGCRTCICLRNNRMVCSNCTEKDNVCSSKDTGVTFNIGCNTCECDDKGQVYCTVRKCLNYHVDPPDVIYGRMLVSVHTPLNDIDCETGTKYKKDCNICFCFKGQDNAKKFGCTQDKCVKSDYLRSCVNGSLYEMNCLICHCGVYNGKLMEICHKNPKCNMPTTQDLQQLADKSYCQPLQTYKSSCNTCECLPDGKTVRCTADRCLYTSNTMTGEHAAIGVDSSSSDSTLPISVEIVPVMKDIGGCPKSKSFIIDCNVCVCLSNGDVVCTAEDCSKRN